MSWKSVFGYMGILILSVVVTYGVAIIDALKRDNLIAGSSGIPLKFASSALFGGVSTNYLNLFLDIIFWFVVIWVILKIIRGIIKR